MSYPDVERPSTVRAGFLRVREEEDIVIRGEPPRSDLAAPYVGPPAPPNETGSYGAILIDSASNP